MNWPQFFDRNTELVAGFCIGLAMLIFFVLMMVLDPPSRHNEKLRETEAEIERLEKEIELMRLKIEGTAE